VRILVTGGAGFIGSHIVDALLAEHNVSVLDDLSSGDRKNISADAAFYEVDIRDGAAVHNVIGRVVPEAIFHEAAQMSVSASVRDPVVDAEINACGLLNVLSAASEQNVQRFIFASSGGVLYGETTSPADESHPLRPATPYGITKWVGERYLEFYSTSRGMTTVALRYSNVYGPRQNPHGEAGVVAIFARKLLRGEKPTINGDGRCVRDYVHVSDVVAANLAAMNRPLRGFSAFNVGTAVGTDVNALAERIRNSCTRALLARGVRSPVPNFAHGPDRPGDLRSNLISPRKAEQLLDWRPAVSLADGIDQTVDWFAHRELVASGPY
jgi:UDP-glucose 4-epimerase